MTGALLDRLPYHAHILTMNGQSDRLARSTARRRPAAQAQPGDAATPQEAWFYASHAGRILLRR